MEPYLAPAAGLEFSAVTARGQHVVQWLWELLDLQLRLFFLPLALISCGLMFATTSIASNYLLLLGLS